GLQHEHPHAHLPVGDPCGRSCPDGASGSSADRAARAGPKVPTATAARDDVTGCPATGAEGTLRRHRAPSKLAAEHPSSGGHIVTTRTQDNEVRKMATL